MHSSSRLSRLIHHYPPRVWLAIAGVSLLLATGSTMVLVSKIGEDQKDKLVLPFDAMGRFMRDTIRLTFKTNVGRESVFVAPKRILDATVTFNWVETFRDFTPEAEAAPPAPKAPIRVLDPDWKPRFSGGKQEDLTR